jgi:CO/xanthine dehydrogenase FAD-binding subunit
LLTAAGDAEAMTVARLIPHHHEEPESRLTAIARWLAQLYPATVGTGQINIGPLEPDRLGEVLVADVLRRHPDLLATALGAASDRQVTQALTIAGRIAQVDQDIREQLRAALDALMADLSRRGTNARR